MSVSSLSDSSQNYLKAIWSLNEWSDTPVTASMIAARVGVRLSTTSDAVRRLAEQGLVQHTPYGAVTLTESGRRHALTMVRRHRLLETFLAEVLGYRWDQIHDEADALEHAVSDFLIERIDAHLGHPTRDPHGDPIPTADGMLTHPEAVQLSQLAPGQSVRVERISDHDPEMLQFFAGQGLLVDTILQTRAGAPYTDVIEVIVGDPPTPLALGREAAQAVWVTPAAGAACRDSNGARPRP